MGLFEVADPEGPLGAKEVGEGSLAAIIPAVTNAIYDALGIWVTDLPMTPEKVLAALDAKREGNAIPKAPHPSLARTTIPESDGAQAR